MCSVLVFTAWRGNHPPYRQMLLCCTAQNAESLRCCRPLPACSFCRRASVKQCENVSKFCNSKCQRLIQNQPAKCFSQLCITWDVGKCSQTTNDVFYYRRLCFSTGQLLYRVSALVFALHTGNTFVMHARGGNRASGSNGAVAGVIWKVMGHILNLISLAYEY